MEVNFREYEPKNKKILTQLVLDFYKEIPSIKKVRNQNVEYTISELQQYPEKGIIIVFEVNEGVVGYAILIFFWSNEFGGNFVNVDELYVKPEFRNQGIGNQFFSYLKQKFTTAVAIQLEVNPQNKKAYQFYQKMGFKTHENMVLDLEISDN